MWRPALRWRRGFQPASAPLPVCECGLIAEGFCERTLTMLETNND